ncbi:MAG TPA: hypothetical protein VK447_02460, partial [Myxococcaceae bacterium]|nr:hypothetical protein [Myxococcaceae bacterium]
ATLRTRARRVESRRAREAERLFEERQAAPEAPEEPEADVAPKKRDESLKSLYRSLARRFHPDLATTEEERVRFGEWMARINGLYHSGDMDGLRRLADQLETEVEPDFSETPEAERLLELEEKLAWLDTVVANLEEQRRGLERTPTFELWRKVEQGLQDGRDVLEEIAVGLREQAEKSYADVRDAATRLERRVSEYNRRGAELARQGQVDDSSALDRVFDPYANRKLVRLGMEALAQARFSPGAKPQAEWLEGLAKEKPAVLRLVLFTYASERCEHAPPGLETYDGLALRFEHLGREDQKRLGLEQTLVEAADVLEFGVLKASERRAKAGLRFRSETLREAVPLALRAAAIRRELKQVLAVLGKRVTCKKCQEQVFEVPLYKLRGLDDLHASVCPACGAVLESYWMPSGKNIQSELNDAFLDLELVTEYAFRISRESIAMQLLPRQAEELTVGDLKRRFCAEVLDRHGLGIEAAQVQLTQRRKKVDEEVVLADLEETGFTVTFSRGAKLSTAEAMELVRHRVRNRFKPDAKPAPTPPRE